LGYLKDCFSRGLLREALGQLAGLKRRKLALEMLGTAIQTGLDQRDTDQSGRRDDNKRKAGTDPALQNDNETGGGEDNTEPAAKRPRTSGP
jgi:hypothetical protein